MCVRVNKQTNVHLIYVWIHKFRKILRYDYIMFNSTIFNSYGKSKFIKLHSILSNIIDVSCEFYFIESTFSIMI